MESYQCPVERHAWFVLGNVAVALGIVVTMVTLVAVVLASKNQDGPLFYVLVAIVVVAFASGSFLVLILYRLCRVFRLETLERLEEEEEEEALKRSEESTETDSTAEEEEEEQQQQNPLVKISA